jgi:hypothetical protein
VLTGVLQTANAMAKKTSFGLFLKGFVYVALQAAVTWLIANKVPAGIMVAIYVLNYQWGRNVKSMGISSNVQQHIYSAGAACGAISAYYLMEFINHLLTNTQL